MSQEKLNVSQNPELIMTIQPEGVMSFCNIELETKLTEADLLAFENMLNRMVQSAYVDGKNVGYSHGYNEGYSEASGEEQ